MITAFEALLLPACAAVFLGLALGFGLESLIHLFDTLFGSRSARRVDGCVAAARTAARRHASGYAKPAGCGRTSL
ncbi:hypothetical protein [Paludisphaera rhizosphaerae]|uniref:hypothetical protein n=1 Tax=Paludisphaera rhizosphaerae TaxID=2711216 RepID=UPI0013E9C426|nr:hypothetical protein [Paludisphaera rhizosphaerae]